MAEADNKPPFEGTLVYVAVDGRWIAGVPSRDITAEEWVSAGYSDRANFTPEDLVKTGLYELKPPRAKPGQGQSQSQGKTAKADDTAKANSTPADSTNTSDPTKE